MSKIILFQGDSITDGNRLKEKSQEGDLNHQMGHSYAYIINWLLGSEYPKKQLKFVNRGISANRLVDIYARIDKDIIGIKPDVMSLLVGVNDAPYDFNNYVGTDPKKIEVLYRMLLDEVLAALPQLQLVLCEPFIARSGQVKEGHDRRYRYISAYQKIVRRIAEEYHGKFVPLQQKFDEACQIREPEYWVWDGIHPTENGHGLIAGEWLIVAKEIIVG